MKHSKKFILIIILLSLLVGCHTQNNNAINHKKQDNSEEVSRYLVAEPVYPEMTPYPNEKDYIRADGNFDDEGFDKVYDAWWSDKKIQRDFHEQFKGDYRDFYRKTAQIILKDEQQVNQVYSPISLYMGLAMLSETTEGKSKEQILALLGDFSDTIADDAKALWNANYSADTASNSILANSLWLNKNLAYQKETIDKITDRYYASIFQGDMGSDEYSQTLRNWINQQTGNLLTEQTKDLRFSEETVLSLISTVYFQQKWADEFLKMNNTEDTFYGEKKEVKTEYMHQSGNDVYYWADHFSAVNKPLLDGSSSMWFILPDENSTVEDVLANEQLFALTSTHPVLSDWQNKKDLKINLSVPKFDIAANYNLAEHLKTLGMTDVFAKNIANFSPLLKNSDIPVWLSEAKQGTRVAIDEEGVTAASFTAMETAGAAMPLTEEIDFILNRPFLFVITGITGDPLFIGVVNQL